MSRLTWGTVSLGGFFGEAPADAANRMLEACRDLSVNVIDAAPRYGDGLAEARLGEALRRWPRDEFVLSSKVGWTVDEQGARLDLSPDALKRGLEQTLLRLDVSTLDVCLLHDPDDDLSTAVAQAWPVLEQWRSEGVVRAIGVGTTDVPTATAMVEQTDLDVLLMASRLTLLDSSATREVIPRARERGVFTWIGAVLSSGILADPERGDVTHLHAPVSEDVRERAMAMRAACWRYGLELRTAAVQYAASTPGVDAVLLGTCSPEKLRQVAADLETTIPPELQVELSALAAT